MQSGEREDRGGPVPKVEGFVDLVLIGSGGSSSVYSATQEALQRRVALKVLHDLGDQSRRLERESKALVALTGTPHVVEVHDVVHTADGHSVLVMPLLSESLANRVRTAGPQPLDRVVRWAAQLAEGLGAAHRRGIAHRDIKPENVLLSADDEAFLVDFGIAGIEEMETGTITIASISPPHAPPERFTDDAVDEQAGDIYSLASTLYFALTGHTAFGTMSEGGSLGLMRRITSDPVPVAPGTPPQVSAVIARAMSKQPAARYPHVTDFADALGVAAVTPVEPTLLPPPLPPALPDRPASGEWRPPVGVDPRPAGDTVVKPDTGRRPKAAPPDAAPPEVPPDLAPPAPAAVAEPAGPTTPARMPRRHRLAVVAAVASAGLVVGFVVFRLWTPPAGTSSMEVVVRDATSKNPLPDPTTIAVNGTTWRPAFHDRTARRTFDAAFHDGRPAVVSVDSPERLNARVKSDPESTGGPQVVSVVVTDDAVEVGSTKLPRNNPQGERDRLREEFKPLSDLNEKAQIANRSIYGPQGTASYDAIDAGIDQQVMPKIEQGISLIEAARTTDPDVQKVIDAYLRCWQSKRDFYLEEKAGGWDRVPRDPADTYEQRRNAADQAADRAALDKSETLCSDPLVKSLHAG